MSAGLRFTFHVLRQLPHGRPLKGIIDMTANGFNMNLVQRGARLRRTPYFAATQKYGAKGYTVYNHMLFPIQYDEFEAEHNALMDEVTVWDVSVERQVEITGRDA